MKEENRTLRSATDRWNVGFLQKWPVIFYSHPTMPLDVRNQIAVLRDEKPLSLEKTMEETMTSGGLICIKA